MRNVSLSAREMIRIAEIRLKDLGLVDLLSEQEYKIAWANFDDIISLLRKEMDKTSGRQIGMALEKRAANE
ncbi:MAG: hypothetical protein ACRD5H_00890 [Nitrososphaerales archaeon]